MAATVNKVTLIGMVGKDPEIRSFPSGDRVANFSVATSEKWKDKASGESKEATEWHKISVFNEHLIKLCESMVKKGALVHIEGQNKTRKYEKDGREVYTTEVVLQKYKGEINILQFAKDDSPKAEAVSEHNDMNSEIPF